MEEELIQLIVFIFQLVFKLIRFVIVSIYRLIRGIFRGIAAAFRFVARQQSGEGEKAQPGATPQRTAPAPRAPAPSRTSPSRAAAPAPAAPVPLPGAFDLVSAQVTRRLEAVARQAAVEAERCSHEEPNRRFCALLQDYVVPHAAEAKRGLGMGGGRWPLTSRSSPSWSG